MRRHAVLAVGGPGHPPRPGHHQDLSGGGLLIDVDKSGLVITVVDSLHFDALLYPAFFNFF